MNRNRAFSTPQFEVLEQRLLLDSNPWTAPFDHDAEYSHKIVDTYGTGASYRFASSDPSIHWDATQGTFQHNAIAITLGLANSHIEADSAISAEFTAPEDGWYEFTFDVTATTKIVSASNAMIGPDLGFGTFDVSLSSHILDSSGNRAHFGMAPELTLYETDFDDRLHFVSEKLNDAMVQGVINAIPGGQYATMLLDLLRADDIQESVISDSGALTVSAALKKDEVYSWTHVASAEVHSVSWNPSGIHMAAALTEVTINSVSYTVDPSNPDPDPVVPEQNITVEERVGTSNDGVLAFGTVHERDSVSGTFTVVNTGGEDLHLYGWESDSSYFTLSPGSPSDGTLAPGDSVTATVTFEPRATTSYPGTITIHSDDPDTPEYTLSVTGSGQNLPPLALLTCDLDGWVGRSVHFEGMGMDPDGDSIEQYEWDFGDGNMLAGQVNEHIYYTPGNYNVRFRVQDSNTAWSDWASYTLPVKQQKIRAVVVGQKNLDGSGTLTGYHRDAQAIADHLRTLNPSRFIEDVTVIQIDYLNGTWKVNEHEGTAIDVKEEIREAISGALNALGANDFFAFAFVGKSGYEDSGDETPVDIYTAAGGLVASQNTGDEFLALTPSTAMTDDELAEWLSGHDDVSKAVWLSGSYTGGFWGDPSNALDADLSTIPNTVLLAATAESTQAVGVSIGEAIEDENVVHSPHAIYIAEAIRVSNGWAPADVNQEGLTVSEMADYVAQCESATWQEPLVLFEDPSTLVPAAVPEPVVSVSAEFSYGVLLYSPAIHAAVEGTVWEDVDGFGYMYIWQVLLSF